VDGFARTDAKTVGVGGILFPSNRAEESTSVPAILGNHYTNLVCRPQEALSAYQRCLRSQPTALRDSVIKAADVMPIQEAFATAPSFDAFITRFASFVASEALYLNSSGLEVFPADDMVGRSVILERFIKSLEVAEHRHEVANLMVRVLLELLASYTEGQHPIRRSR
jgi:hypothetical protein